MIIAQSHDERITLPRSLHFHAADDDLLPILFEVLERHPVLIYRTGKVDGIPSPIQTKDIKIGTTAIEQQAHDKPYLFLPVGVAPRLSICTLVSGESISVLDQLLNNESVVLASGGRRSDGVVICGSIGTAWKSTFADGLLRDFAAGLRKRFTKVRAYWVGPKALELLRSGSRLTHAIQSPRLYDLREDV